MPHRSDGWMYLAVAAIAAAALAIDPNSHFAAENDIYMLRQIQALRELAPWRWNWTEPGQAAMQAAFWIANLSFYFHGPVPPVVQAAFLDIAEAIFGATGPGTYFASAGLFYVLAAPLFASVLRAAGVGALAAMLAAIALCASPVWLALARGFGASWLVAVVFSQCLVVRAAQLALDGRRSGLAALAFAFAFLLVSDVLAPLAIVAVVAAMAVAGRDEPARLVGILRSRWMLLPATCVAWIVAANVFAATRGVRHASDLVLFVYPFAQYLIGLPGQESSIGSAGWNWVERARILVLLFGLGVFAAFPAALAGAVSRRESHGTGRPRIFVYVWSVLAFAGYAAVFLFVSGPSTGSQAMPIIGYPIFLLVPGAALLATTLGSGRFAIPAAMLWVAGSALGAWIYVWRVDVPHAGGLLTVREGTDVVGFRYPDAGVMGAGVIVRAAVEAAAPPASISVATVLDRPFAGLRNVLAWRAGIVDGGAFARTGRNCIATTVIDTGGGVLEAASTPAAEALAARVAAACDAPICVGVGHAEVLPGWRIDVRGEAGQSIAVFGFGVPRPPGFADAVASTEIEAGAARATRGLAGSPVGYMGMAKALRIVPADCPAAPAG